MLRTGWSVRFAPVLMLGLFAGGAQAYVAPVGFQKTGQSFAGSAIAVAPDGKVAVGSDNFAGNASVAVYSSLAQVGGTPLTTISLPTMKFIAGIEFLDNNTVVFGDNGSINTVLTATLSPGAVTPTLLAPQNSVPNLGDIAIKNGIVYATAANGLNAQSQGINRLYQISGNAASVVIDNFGTGYIGGVVVDAQGNFLIADSGAGGGLVRRFKPDFSVLDTISLIPGNGSGAYDLALDSEGDLFVSTGSTLTQVKFPGGVPTVAPFGMFGGDFPWPTYLAYTGSQFEPSLGDGLLLVSGFTDEPGVFVVQTPEPGGILALAGAIGLLLRRNRKEVAL